METTFKIGDRVLTHSTPTPLTTKLLVQPLNYILGGYGFVPNTELVIKSIIYKQFYNVMFFENCDHGIYEGNFSLTKKSHSIWKI